MKDKIRVGLLIDSFQLPKWIVEMIKKISAIPNVEIALIIVNASPRKKVYSTPWCYRFFSKVDSVLYKTAPKADELSDLLPFIKAIPQVCVSVGDSEKKHKIDQADINGISTYKPDVLIKLGFEGLSGAILNLPKFGVWSLDLYDEKPVAFIPGSVQFFNDNDITPSSVKMLSNDRDKEKILYRSFAMTDKRSLTRNLNKVYWKSLSFIPRLLKLLAQNGEDWFWSHVEQNNKRPGNEAVIINDTLTNGKILNTLFSKSWKEIIKRIKNNKNAEYWNLFYNVGDCNHIETSVASFLKIPCPDKAFWADPHIVKFDSRTFIFFEEWDYKKNKGHISALEFSDAHTALNKVKVLEKPYHLSYPFVFEWNGAFYMIPETAGNKTIELYKCAAFPYEWTFVMNLMENIYATDTTLYHYDNKWWLFVNIVENEGAPSLDELFVFYADDLFTTDWKAHQLNPVLSDCRRARPAGAFFSMDNKLYRPSQCSDKTYGTSVNINEVVNLTKDIYHETNIASLVPAESDDCKGIHSYSKVGELTVIDKFFFEENN